MKSKRKTIASVLVVSLFCFFVGGFLKVGYCDSTIGVNSVGAKYAYDSSIVWKKLSSYKYSNNGKKIVFLTFDDGPSTTNTPKVLNILDKNNVKATFFIVGQNLKNPIARKLLKQEYDSGNAIASHTYSHDYKYLYPGRSLNLNNFVADINKNEVALKSVLGQDFSTRVIRCPGGYMSWKNMIPLKNYALKNNLALIDWNALSKDAEGKKKNADQLVANAIETSKNKEMVVLLMHDTYGKEETVKSLDRIIQYFKSNGYEFRTLN